MEKKSMVLLTVVAVATLLVTVVGATFAYFTATITNGGTSTQTQVTTTTIANATFNQGTAVSESNWCPGKYVAKKFDIKTTAGSAAAKVKISFDTATSTFTTSNMKYSLYEADSDTALPTVTPGTCAYSAIGGGQKYSANGAVGTGTPVKTGVLKSGGITALDYVATIPANSAKYYVLVVYLEETNADQSADQGKNINLTLKATMVNA